MRAAATIAAVLIALAAAPPALARRLPSAPRAAARALMRAADVTHDGELTRRDARRNGFARRLLNLADRRSGRRHLRDHRVGLRELRRFAARFAGRDGRLSKADWRRMLSRLGVTALPRHRRGGGGQTPPPPPVVPPPPPPTPPAAGPCPFDSITIDEAATTLLHHWDFNHDGVLTTDDAWAVRNILVALGVRRIDLAGMETLVAGYDTSPADGCYSRTEDHVLATWLNPIVNAFPPGLLPPGRISDAVRGLLDTNDTDHDGVLTAADGANAQKLLDYTGATSLDAAALTTLVEAFDADDDGWLVESEQVAFFDATGV